MFRIIRNKDGYFWREEKPNGRKFAKLPKGEIHHSATHDKETADKVVKTLNGR